jgi:ABC-2 type transport system ATP-binding protein
METVIETDKLSKSYDRAVVVNGIDLKVRAGEIFGFLGPNGAGKTTTMKIPYRRQWQGGWL